MRWLVPLTAATAVSIHYDADALQALSNDAGRDRISRAFSNVGAYPSVFGIAAASYLIGSWSHHERMRETGVLGTEAILNSFVVVSTIKLAANRERATDGDGRGHFWAHGTRGYPNTSFPSGHAAGSFALARIIAEETPEHPILHIGLYTLAAGVCATRIVGRTHFPSDVIVGGTLGYLIGGYVYKHHSEASIENGSSLNLFPVFGPTGRLQGIGVSVHPETLRNIFHRTKR